MAPALEEPLCGGKDVAIDGAGAPADGVSKEGSLSAIALPTSTIRRILRSALPEGKLSAEAVAAFHRIAQVFICWLTHGACRQLADAGKKSKGKAAATKPPISAELVMSFLHSELPFVANKVANLFPEIVGAEHKPAAVHLLEQLQRKDGVFQLGSEAGSGIAAAATSALPELLREFPEAGALDGQEQQSAFVAKKGKGKRPAEKQSAPKMATKRPKRSTEAAAKQPEVVPRPLSYFFAAGA
mmetsp:Transcript_8914/g.16003  ORF Transcript_8914/g.16003 Transcript_8914/m.16003 type:complete len:242 (-) Transcript_8914:114-839(-)